MLCTKFWWILAQEFWRKRFFFNSVDVFSLFCNYLHLEKCRVLHLNKLQNPSQKDSLCPVWLKLAQWFLRRRYFNFVNVFSLLRYYLPLKRAGSFISTNLNSLYLRMFVSNLVDIGSVIMEKKMKMWKIYRQTKIRRNRRTIDNRRSEKPTWAISSGE